MAMAGRLVVWPTSPSWKGLGGETDMAGGVVVSASFPSWKSLGGETDTAMAGRLVVWPSFPSRKSLGGATDMVVGNSQRVQALCSFVSGCAASQLSRRARCRRQRPNLIWRSHLTDHADAAVGECESSQVLERLRVSIDSLGGNSKAADDRELLRFLHAQSFNTDEAAKAVASHQRWRSELVPHGYVSETDLPAELGSKKAYWIGRTKKGSPAVLVLGRNHFQNKNDFDEFKRFVVYSIERLVRETPPSLERFIAVVDLKGLGLKNLDSKSFLAAFDILQNHYPGRLEKLFLVNVPLIFNGVWKVAKPFLQQETKNRIVFVDKNKLVETLTNEIDLDFLPKDYGGFADLVLVQDTKTPNWPPSS